MAVADRSLQVALEQVVGLGLGLAELHGVDELGLGLLVLAFLDPAIDELVERAAELGQLVGTGRVDSGGELPGSHLGSESRVAADSWYDVADQRHDAAYAHQQRNGHDNGQLRARALVVPVDADAGGACLPGLSSLHRRDGGSHGRQGAGHRSPRRGGSRTGSMSWPW
jgi:hypothetical protein